MHIYAVGIYVQFSPYSEILKHFKGKKFLIEKCI